MLPLWRPTGVQFRSASLSLVCGLNDLSIKSKHSILPLYADDLKVFRKVSTDNDRSLLQKYLNALVDWCESNRLPLNVGKYKVVTHSRKSAHEVRFGRTSSRK